MPIPQKLLHPIPCSAITTKSTLWKKKVKITAYSRSATVHSWLSFFSPFLQNSTPSPIPINTRANHQKFPF